MKISNKTTVPHQLPNGITIAPGSHIYITDAAWNGISGDDIVKSWLDQGFLIAEAGPGEPPPPEVPLDINERIRVGNRSVTLAQLGTVLSTGGGLKVVSITQAAYDALSVKDPNTLYVIP